MTCEQRTDSIFLLAAGALPAVEADELRRHLATGCPACAGGLVEASAAVALLPFSLDLVPPPAGLKDRLMKRIDGGSAGSTMKIVPPPSVSAESFAGRVFRMFVPAAVAAGIAVVATHYVLNQELVRTQNQAREYQIQAVSARGLVVSMSEQMEAVAGKAKSQGKVIEMLRSPDLKLVRLSPTEFQKGAVVNLVWDQDQRQWALVATGMKPAATGETYELWFVTKGGPVRAGLFDVDAKGSGSLWVAIPPTVSDLTLAAVTNEKAGGADSPHGNFQVTAKLQ